MLPQVRVKIEKIGFPPPILLSTNRHFLLQLLLVVLFFFQAINHLPLDPKTMKNEGFTPPTYGL